MPQDTWEGGLLIKTLTLKAESYVTLTSYEKDYFRRFFSRCFCLYLNVVGLHLSLDNIALCIRLFITMIMHSCIGIECNELDTLHDNAIKMPQYIV